MADRGKNIVIGIFVIAAIGIMIFILLYLKPTVGDLAKTLKVRFDNIEKVTIGTRVTFAGRPIGEVTDIQEVPSARAEQQMREGPVYIYELTFKIDSANNVYDQDLISIKTAGLLGERSVDITPRPPRDGKPLLLVKDGTILYGESTVSVEEAVKEFKNLMTRAETTVNLVNGQLKEINERKLWENVAGAAKNINEMTASLNKPKEWSELVNNVHKFSSDLAGASERVNKGEGALGKLLTKDDLYLHTTSLMSKAETLMDDINHYGILFHLDKGWQRVRARRVNLMNKLQSPQEFRNFFNDEVDEVTTSLARVAHVLEETEKCCPREELMKSPEFSGVFTELLRRIKALEDNINLYNQQVIEVREKPLQSCP